MAHRTRAAALVVAAACAMAGPAAPPAPPSFDGVRTIALVRWSDEAREARPKDPLDALGESLAARGYATRAVEIGPKAAGEIVRLYSAVDARIEARLGPDRSGRLPERVDPGLAAAALGPLGVDAAAFYHRFTGPAPFRPPRAGDPLDPLAPPGAFYPPRPDEVPYRRIGAVALVDRGGSLAWFDWGTPAPEDPGVPANAAEAVDALLRVLSGEPDDG